MKPMGNTYVHEKPSDLEVERARLKSVIHGILISSITQRIFPLQFTSQGPFRPGSLCLSPVATRKDPLFNLPSLVVCAKLAASQSDGPAGSHFYFGMTPLPIIHC